MIKVNSFVRVIQTNEVLKVTRIDKHVYPICAGYRRFKYKDLQTMSIFINVPSGLIDKYNSLFIRCADHIEFTYDYNVFRLYPRFDEDTGQNVYFHPCNVSGLFSVYQRYFLENLDPVDYNLIYAS
jgi:hypothetical protein